MLFCINCGTQLNPGDGFCRSCGTPVPAQTPAEPVAAETTYAPPAPVEPTYAPPAYTPPPYTPPVYTPPAPEYNNIPVYHAEPVITPKAKALGFVGMSLGIAGLFFAVIGLLYTLIGLEEEVVGFVFAMVFSILSLPCSILGKVFYSKAEEAGNTTTPPSVGNKLGLAGIIVSAVMLFFGFISLMIA